jgi:hypothetical protein
MDLYRAEAARRHRGRATKWAGKWRKYPQRAIEQALRWKQREPSAEISIVTHAGSKISMLELEPN